MVAEPDVADMKGRLKDLEDERDKMQLKIQELDEATKRKQETFEKQLKVFDDEKEDFGDKLQVKLNAMEIDTQHKHADSIKGMQYIVEEAKNQFTAIEDAAQGKFEEIENRMNKLYQELIAKFQEIDGNMGASKPNEKKCGFLPDKMMVPKTFKEDIGTWRKWKENVSKYFDDQLEGMKGVMDEVSK